MARTITATGGNLFTIALQELGDARAAHRIAAANKMVDFWFTGQQTLIIPEIEPDQTNDGLPLIPTTLPQG